MDAFHVAAPGTGQGVRVLRTDAAHRGSTTEFWSAYSDRGHVATDDRATRSNFCSSTEMKELHSLADEVSRRLLSVTNKDVLLSWVLNSAPKLGHTAGSPLQPSPDLHMSPRVRVQHHPARVHVSSPSPSSSASASEGGTDPVCSVAASESSDGDERNLPSPQGFGIGTQKGLPIGVPISTSKTARNDVLQGSPVDEFSGEMNNATVSAPNPRALCGEVQGRACPHPPAVVPSSGNSANWRACGLWGRQPMGEGGCEAEGSEGVRRERGERAWGRQGVPAGNPLPAVVAPLPAGTALVPCKRSSKAIQEQSASLEASGPHRLSQPGLLSRLLAWSGYAALMAAEAIATAVLDVSALLDEDGWEDEEEVSSVNERTANPREAVPAESTKATVSLREITSELVRSPAVQSIKKSIEKLCSEARKQNEALFKLFLRKSVDKPVANRLYSTQSSSKDSLWRRRQARMPMPLVLKTRCSTS